jgi:hypothetical protein
MKSTPFLMSGSKDNFGMPADDFSENPEKGWPGDGSGMDDFADLNQNEANDYREE